MSSTPFGIAFSSHLILFSSQAVDKGLLFPHAASSITTSTAAFNRSIGYSMMIYFMSLPSWASHSSFSAAWPCVLLPTLCLQSCIHYNVFVSFFVPISWDAWTWVWSLWIFTVFVHCSYFSNFWLAVIAFCLVGLGCGGISCGGIILDKRWNWVKLHAWTYL